MKLIKKLIPALGMLTLSAVMLVTSSFAWFSMNDTVKATGMSVTAKGDQIYLQIIKETDSFTAGAAQTSASAVTATENLKPSAVKSKDGGAYIDYDATKGVNWVTALGTSATNGTKLGDYSEATNSTETKYYLKNIFKIRLDETAGNTVAPGALRVSGVNFAGADAEGKATVDALGTSVSVLVICGDKSQLWMQVGTDGKFTQVDDSSEYLDANTSNKFDNKVGVNVEVYVFFNGDDADCRLESLAGATNNYSVEVSFTVAA